MSEMIRLPDDPRPAIDVFIGYATGMVTDELEVAHAGVHFLGYGLGIVHKHPEPVPMASAGNATIKGCCEEIKAIVGAKKGVGDAEAFPWAALIPLVMQIIQLFLSKKQPS